FFLPYQIFLFDFLRRFQFHYLGPDALQRNLPAFYLLIQFSSIQFRNSAIDPVQILLTLCYFLFHTGDIDFQLIDLLLASQFAPFKQTNNTSGNLTLTALIQTIEGNEDLSILVRPGFLSTSIPKIYPIQQMAKK